jgi:hypothetical protein
VFWDAKKLKVGYQFQQVGAAGKFLAVALTEGSTPPG